MNQKHYISKKDRAIELIQEGLDHLEESYNLLSDMEDVMTFKTEKFMDKFDILLNQLTMLTGKEIDEEVYGTLERELKAKESGEFEDEEDEEDEED